MTEANQPYGEVAAVFADVSRTLLSQPTVLGTLQQIVDFAVVTVEGCNAAGISLLTGTEVATPVFSDEIALEIDLVQYETGEGPCLDAITKDTIVYAEDLSADERWPSFGPRATTLGMRSLLSCRLLDHRTLGALNLYARIPRAYSTIDRTKALIFAAHAGIALGAAETAESIALSLDSEIRRNDSLHIALATREIIGQAQGILMERERLNATQAFDILRRASQHLNRKLREVAQDLVDTGERPETGSSPPMPSDQ